jgi:iron-sulfur cluster insertion protein
LITFSESAREQLKNLSEIQEGVLRLTIRSKGCAGLTYELVLADCADADDKEIDCRDFLLYLDGSKIMYLIGTHIDHKDDIEGRRFVYSNSAFNLCGCGSSFRVGGDR